MKKVKLVAVIAILLVSVIALSACNIGDIISDMFRAAVVDYEFTDDGFEEVAKFYDGFYNADTDLTITWEDRNNVDDESVIIKWSRRKVEDTMQYSILYKDEDSNNRMITLSDTEKYTIDENEKTYKEENGVDIANQMFIGVCAIKLTEVNNQPVWTFVEREDNVTIDFYGQDCETMQYEYTGIEGSPSDKLIINFDKKSFLGLFPVIRRIEYQNDDDDNIIIYVKALPSDNIDAKDFASPVGNEAYTLET